MKYFLTRDFSKTITAVFSAFVFLLFLTAANFSSASPGQWCYTGLVSPQCFNTQAECVTESSADKCHQEATTEQPTGQTATPTQNVSCAGGTGTCMVSGCAPTDSKPADSVCGIYDCCVPSSAQTTPTCENSGGVCFLTCDTGYHSIDKVCASGGSCCVANEPTKTGTADTGNSGSNSGTGSNTGTSGSLLGGLVQCGTGEGPESANECGFNDIISLIQRVINFLLFVIAMPLAAIALTWTGFQLMLASSQGKADGLGMLKQRMFLIVGGFGLALAAWLIVHAIVAGLGVSETYNFLGS